MSLWLTASDLEGSPGAVVCVRLATPGCIPFGAHHRSHRSLAPVFPYTEQLDGAQRVLLERLAALEACLCISQLWSLILLLVPPKFGAKQSGECVGLEKGHFSAATRKLDCDVLE